MELRHLRYFLAVAEELHFGRAAARLRMAQPPLSQQIRRLERDLGVVLGQAEHAALVVQQASRGEVGRLRVGFVSSATYDLLPTVLRVFRQRFHGVALTLHELTTEQQVQALTGSLIDVGFLRPPVHSNALALETVLREPFVVALPESDALASSSTVSLVSLAGAPFILSPRHAGQGFYDHILTFCLKFGFSPRVVQEAAETQTIVSLVAAGIGVALVPASVEKLRLPGVIYRRLREQSPTLEMALASRQEDRSPVLRAFINVVREGRRS